MDYYREINNLIEQQENWRSSCLNMIASENITSKAVRNATISDFQHRYAEGFLLGKDSEGLQLFDRFYQGTKYFDRIEALAMKLSEELFEADHANVAPISGVVANLTAYYALAQHGDVLFSLNIPSGGHISHNKVSAAGVIGLRNISYPFDAKEMNIDVEETKKLAIKERPKLFLFGGSLFLFPHPVNELRELANELNAYIVYDAAHVLGLIAGKRFQDPFREGADVITSSTHKTFPGPQHGLVMCKNEFREKIDRAAFPGLTSNHHLHNIAGFAIALTEMMKFGKEYATQIVKNSKSLGQSMYELGFNVLCEHKGFTESHQIAIDVSKYGGGQKVAKDLEEANILVNKNLLPWESAKNSRNPSGLRIGVQEMTRLGMKESEMKYVAGLMKKLVLDKTKTEEIKKDVIEFRKKYQKIHYCFD